VSIVITHTDEMEWQNGLDVVRAMTPEFRDNLGPADEVEQLYVKYAQKTVRHDPDTTRRFDLVRLDGGYRDLTNAYHDSVEECLMLSGEVSLDGEGHFDADGYFWRPPGWVHAADTTEGFTALLLLQGDDPSEGSGPTSRRIRPDSEAGTNPLHPMSDPMAVGPRGWVRNHTRFLPWQPGHVYARNQGDLALADIDGLNVRVLSANPFTGGQSVLWRLDPGYQQDGGATSTAELELFVIDGSAAVGGEDLRPGSYARIPAGTAPPLSSTAGATLFVKLDGWWSRHGA
jgi:hypothetical protein